MSKKEKPNLPPVAPGANASKTGRRASAAALMREQQARAKRRSVLIQVAVGLVAVVVVVAAVVVFANRDSGGSAKTPAGLTADGAVRFGEEDAPVVVQVVEDFQCPVCREFESVAGDLLAQYRDSDDVAVEYRPIAFLDEMTSTDYSTRALNASMCVLDESGRDSWRRFAKSLFEQQPAEGSAGLPDRDLIDLAADAGASGDAIESCIEDRPYDGWAADTTQRTFDAGVTGTPTVFVNGEKLNGFDTATIEAAVQAARTS